MSNDGPLSGSSLEGFAAATVEEADALALLRRFDSKYRLDESQLPAFLAALAGRYKVLPAAGQPVAVYRTIYFDTAQHHLFHEHQRGRRPRFKVRLRHYVDREVSYLEVKKKDNHDQTRKHRRPIDYGRNELLPEDLAFLAHRCKVVPAHELVPTLWSNFRRLTLINDVDRERMTVDVDLSFDIDGNARRLPGLAVVELKQERPGQGSPARAALRRLGAHPSRFSKYCLGLAICEANVRTNLLRPLLRSLAPERTAHV